MIIMNIIKYLISILLFLLILPLHAQFPPAAGEPGSTAIHKDSSIIAGWATNCIVSRGFINITDTMVTYTQSGTTSNHAFFGTDTLATGYPETNMTCVSLGDGGSAVLEFEKPIKNEAGPDFAVYENGFQTASTPYQCFLELAYVEVSSDGMNFVRFPSFSNTDTSVQIGGFDQLDPTKIHNLAGKYIVDYGTPFDLGDIADSAGIDINNITHVRVTDVVGILDSVYGNFDSQGRLINDPWPTPFHSCGFDLNAVGVIHYNENQGIDDLIANNTVVSYPNPVKAGKQIIINVPHSGCQDEYITSIVDLNGKTIVACENRTVPLKLSIPGDLCTGLYIIKVISLTGNCFTNKILIE